MCLVLCYQNYLIEKCGCYDLTTAKIIGQEQTQPCLNTTQVRINNTHKKI